MLSLRVISKSESVWDSVVEKANSVIFIVQQSTQFENVYLVDLALLVLFHLALLFFTILGYLKICKYAQKTLFKNLKIWVIAVIRVLYSHDHL